MKNSSGFTLIELLVTIAIIGILAAIAIPQFSSYRQSAFNSRARSDLRNIMTAEEAYYGDNESYTDQLGLLTGVATTSPGVVIDIQHSFGVDWVYGVSAYHERGNKTYCYVSDADGAIREEDGAPTGAVCIH